MIHFFFTQESQEMEVTKVLIAVTFVATLCSIALSAPVKPSPTDIQVLADVISRVVKNGTQEV